MTRSKNTDKNIFMHSFDGPTLEIDLTRLVANYRMLKDRFAGPECAAVVKANAYGLGVEEVAKALAEAGCQTFFVATLSEGIQLRSVLPQRRIAVFHGVGEGEELAFINHRLIPVLNSPRQIARWDGVAREQADRPSILHIDTGMARLGLTQAEFDALDAEAVDRIQACLLMTHLSCSSDPEHEQNIEQLDRFLIASEKFPELPTSLPNSGGILLGEAWHDDLARPGCAIYGINPGDADDSPMLPVVRLSAPIIQIRRLDSEQAVGYGATQTLPAGARVATVALGYADGIYRGLSHKLNGYVDDVAVPLVGRVTMDMMSFDVSELAENELREGDRIAIMNEVQSVNDIAKAADSIGYEVLTRLGARVKRMYTEWTQ